MATKKEMIKAASVIMGQPKVLTWYEAHLTGKPQGDTLTELERGVKKGELNELDALAIAIIVGIQINEKF